MVGLKPDLHAVSVQLAREDHLVLFSNANSTVVERLVVNGAKSHAVVDCIRTASLKPFYVSCFEAEDRLPNTHVISTDGTAVSIRFQHVVAECAIPPARTGTRHGEAKVIQDVIV